MEFHQRVRSGFLTLAAADPGRYLVVDAGQDPDSVTTVVRHRLDRMLPLSEAEVAAQAEARRLAEEEARRKAEEEAARKAQEARLKAEEEARLAREAEAARIKAEAEAARKAEEARLKAEEEARARAEAERLRAEAEEKARAAEAERLRKQAEEEARLRAEAEERRLEKQRRAEEALLKAEEARRLAAAEAAEAAARAAAAAAAAEAASAAPSAPVSDGPHPDDAVTLETPALSRVVRPDDVTQTVPVPKADLSKPPVRPTDETAVLPPVRPADETAVLPPVRPDAGAPGPVSSSGQARSASRPTARRPEGNPADRVPPGIFRDGGSDRTRELPALGDDGRPRRPRPDWAEETPLDDLPTLADELLGRRRDDEYGDGDDERGPRRRG